MEDKKNQVAKNQIARAFYTSFRTASYTVGDSTPSRVVDKFQVVSTLCNPMDCGMPGFSVPHHLPKFAQVHVH